MHVYEQRMHAFMRLFVFVQQGKHHPLAVISPVQNPPCFPKTKCDLALPLLISKKLHLMTCVMTPSIGKWALFETSRAVRKKNSLLQLEAFFGRQICCSWRGSFFQR